MGKSFVDLLIEISHMNVSFFIRNFDVTEVLFKFDIDHVFCDLAPELVCVDVNFDLCLLVTPAKLFDVGGSDLRNSRLSGGCHRSLILRVCFDQYGVAAIDLSIFFKVDGTLR